MPNHHKKLHTKSNIVRVNGKLQEIVTVRDHKDTIVQKILRPLKVEFYPRDVVQIMVGASILAVPVAFTEETWNLGQQLPLINVLGVLALSLFFISIFVYYSYYRGKVKEFYGEFIKRVLTTYFLSALVVGILLTLIQRTPWSTDMILAFKRIILVGFPASMSAAISDFIK